MDGVIPIPDRAIFRMNLVVSLLTGNDSFARAQIGVLGRYLAGIVYLGVDHDIGRKDAQCCGVIFNSLKILPLSGAGNENFQVDLWRF